jgi:hypothetical protein
VSAVISACGQYRYRLDRPGDGFGAARKTAVNVNWSTAAAHDAWRVRKWMEGVR